MEKLKLVMWKNFKIQWRNKSATLAEILVPVLPVLAFLIARSYVKVETIPEATIYESFSPENDIPPVVRNKCNVIYYAPSNPQTQRIMQQIKVEYFDIRGLDYAFVGFERPEKLLKSYEVRFGGRPSRGPLANKTRSGNGGGILLAALIFENLRGKSMPLDIQYTIRVPSSQKTEYDAFKDRFQLRPNWFTEFNYPVVSYRGPRTKKFPQGGFPGYFDEGFLYLQNAVERTMTASLLRNGEERKKLNEMEIQLKRFPHPPYREDKFHWLIQSNLPYFLSFAFVYSAMNITKMIIHEKSTRLKEFMMIMGLDDWVHWTAWFLRSLITLTTSVMLMVVALKVKVKEGEAVLTETNPAIVFGFLMAAAFSVIGFSFFCSTLFDDEQVGATFAGILWVIPSLSMLGLFFNYPKMELLPKYAVCFLLSPNAISLALDIIGMREKDSEGIQWANFWEGDTRNDKFSFGAAVLMLLLNGAIYSAAALYTQLAFPGKFGVSLPWYFPFTKWFWTGSEREGELSGLHQTIPKPIPKPKPPKLTKSALSNVFEKEPAHEKAGIEMECVSKIYSSKIALNNFTIKMFENQVTSLLGHNGAGKTTVMSILTGLTRPSSGSAVVNGWNIRTNMSGVRASLGLCPQYNILFDGLTVEEHLQFFCKLKGLSKGETCEEVDRCLRVLNLEDKRDVLSKSLSGGMKRKLCVGMAFAAGSKVILLDEPTAGMDPVSRRCTWDLIHAQKSGRTVLLSTHYMEEADLLGDRIGIMAHGQLQCCGSSLFLKSKYGGDYTLTIVKKTETGSNSNSNSNRSVSQIKELVTREIPEAALRAEVGPEISFILPGDQIDKFAALLQKLDVWKRHEVFESYGVCSTTMEQVFVRVGVEAERKLGGKASSDVNKHKTKPKPKPKPNSGSVSVSADGDSQWSFNFGNNSESVTELFKRNENLNSGRILWAQQVKAVFVKKLIYGRRNKILFFLQVVVPLAVVSYVLWLLSLNPGGSKTPKRLTFALDNFEENVETRTLFNCPFNSSACRAVKDVLCGEYTCEDIDADLTPVLLERTEKDYVRTTAENILAFEEASSRNNAKNKSGETATVLVGHFNNQHLHVSPLALNLIWNSLLRSFGLRNKLTVSIQPFEAEDADNVGGGADEIGKAFGASYALGIGFAFLTATFVVFPVQEKQVKFKHMQLIAGVKLPIYWLVPFLVDFSVYFAISLAAYGIVLLYDVSQFKVFHIFLKFLVVAGFHGWAMVWFMMLASRFFKYPASGYSKLIAVNASVGFMGMLGIVLLRNPEFDLQSKADGFHAILLFHPNYAVASGTLFLAIQHDLHKYCPFPSGPIMARLCHAKPDHYCCTRLQESYFHWKKYGAGRHIFHMGCTGLLCLCLLVLLESGLIQNLKAYLSKSSRSRSSSQPNGGSATIELMDVDVLNEIRRINQTNLLTLFITDNLVVRDLSKLYSGGFEAVKSLSFGVGKGETFGLLGSNGAGKTTTFKMLTGDISISSGDAFINSYSVMTELKDAQTQLGYCPQFDACLEQLTPRETLTFFARLRGILEANIASVIENVAEDLLFTKFLDVPFGSQSGGNKRKLSTSLALLGDPSTIFLDEPTSGLDPVACRHVWDAVNRVRDGGASVVLTSHNMEEAEALCSKLGIMVKGQFRCIGSPQHLKNKLSHGYTLMVQLSRSGTIFHQCQEQAQLCGEDYDEAVRENDWGTRLEEFTEFLQLTFAGCMLVDAHPGFAQYHIPQKKNSNNSNSTPWWKVFRALEEAKSVFGLDAYTVAQNNLEQVFFAYTYEDEDEEL